MPPELPELFGAAGLFCRASCVAIGNGGAGGALLLDLAGGSWHMSPRLRFVDLAATACVSGSSCFAVGGVTAHWDGRTWTLGRPPAAYGAVTAGGQGAELDGVSCPASNECVGVGGLIDAAKGPASLGSEHAIGDLITVGGGTGAK